MPYYKQTVDDKVVAKKLALEKPSGEGWEPIEGDPALVKIYQEPTVLTEEQEIAVLIQEKIKNLAISELTKDNKLEMVDGKLKAKK